MRTHRNMLVYLAADESAMESLDASVRDYLGWSYVLDHAAALDLTHNQRQQAVDKRALADSTVTDRLEVGLRMGARAGAGRRGQAIHHHHSEGRRWGPPPR